jgi:ribosome maturation factor RimP
VRDADVVGQVRAIAARVAGTHGLEIYDVRFGREAGGMVLRVQIDRPGPGSSAEDSVSVGDCALVSQKASGV